MFQKILIANRGEIACRVIATARRMGVATVAVYSDADAGARHVEMADEAVRIGPAPASESYLKGTAILQAALATGAEAIHPGYGFLSEAPGFVEEVEAAGLVFIGPPAAAIQAMGLKDAAKALMQEAGVPVVPGYHGASQDPDMLAEEAAQIGYPVLIKARAGGGGKGMRLVETAAEFRSALEAAQREADASFGDPHCLIEKYITQPRHIEIQVFADGHGNVLHLFERDCSLQRRHQKVIEEAPAPDMPEEVRAAMGQAAVEAARAVGYQGAGTVEFIADGSKGLRADGFWFMEMNTRLQVEHPVTEAITGLDLVEQQLRVAAGASLPLTQDDLHIIGHAIEARVYAEDPSKGFLPATGTLEHLRFPDGTEFRTAATRIDAGVRQGDQISPHYDPMIAKLIVYGRDRTQALARLVQALEATEIAGLVTNLPFLVRLARHEGFAAGDVDTGLIARVPGLSEAPALPFALRGAAMLFGLGLVQPCGGGGPWQALTGFRAWGAATHRAALIHAGERLESTVTLAQPPRVDGIATKVTPRGDGRFAVQHGDENFTVRHVPLPGGFALIHRGASYRFTSPDPLATGAEGAGSDVILSPMPGKVTSVSISAGDAVVEGQPLMILEAMKMEHSLTAPRDGVIAQLGAAAGDQVQDGTVLIRLETPDG